MNDPNGTDRRSSAAKRPRPTKAKAKAKAKAPSVPAHVDAGQRRRAAPGATAEGSAGVPVVAIGASAGGIDALGRFFGTMPPDSGLAFVVVLHLDPTHESQMARVLGSHTAMPVMAVEDGMWIEPNRVYVIVPDRYLTVCGDRLRLTQPTEARGHRYPVDVLFSSLAINRKERAVAIVLSGTGSNGTHGLQDIRANGGLILVQDPGTARFDGMPRSAIAAGIADHVLAPERMPEVVQWYVRHGYMATPGDQTLAPDDQPFLDPILTLLRTRSGHDFRSYKQSTLQRRIHRRMSLGNVQTAAEYVDVMRGDAEEIKSLVRDLMISVTGFFRNPEAWRALAEKVIAPLFAEREPDAQVRFWVPACATGEEAYSLAMLAVECAEVAEKAIDFKIFATDSQEENLRVARDGIYPHAVAMTLAPERLQRFFERLDSSYRVKKELRELVVFAQQNLLRDPPFSRLDLVTCRNLLIYLEPEAQKRVLAAFHFALREGGHLMLGNVETVGRNEALFEAVSKKWRIYRRVGATQHNVIDFPLLFTPTRVQRPAEWANSEAESSVGAADIARRELLARYAPASVLIDQKGRVLYFHGSTGDYLEPPSGEPTRDLMAMARDGLRPRLRRAMRQAGETRESVTFSARARQGESNRPVTVTVALLGAARTANGLLLVSFQPAPESPATASALPRDGEVESSAEYTLEEELKSARIELQSTFEQMESANEELKAANEEVTSMNEELQSTNEELEASKEELQSFNEELHTINNQLQHKVRELEDLTDDQNNLLAGTEIATIFLDSGCCIKWFSPASVALLDLVPSDIGRPLGHFARKFADDNLLSDAETVLKNLTRIEVEVRSDSGRWYLRRLLPYRTQDNRITGVVLTFTDITERKQEADAVNEERLYSQAIVETIRQPLLVLDVELRVQSANRAFYALFKVAPEDIANRSIYELGNRQWEIPALRTLLEDLVSRDDVIDDVVVEHEFEMLGRRTMLLNARRLSRGGGRADLILLAIEDITARSQAEAHRDLLIRELDHRGKNVLATVQAVASLTLQRTTSLEAFATAFSGRLQALAQAQELLVDEAAGSEIGQLIRWTLEPYRTEDGERITTDGPNVPLAPKAGVAAVMILHELTTNAVKYGALSVSEGKLNVTWRLEHGEDGFQIRLHWIETDGPRVQPPTRHGFGTSLIERSISTELDGEAILDYREEGLRVELTFPCLTAEADKT